MRHGGPCPICKGTVEKIGKQPVTRPDGTVRRAQVFRCCECEFTGFAREFDLQALHVIDDRYAFYYCAELNLALFYREKKPQSDPIHEMLVEVPDLNDRRVTIKLMGLGVPGKDRVLKQIGDPQGPIFPVDLWHDPGSICPQPSCTVDENLMTQWTNFIKRHPDDLPAEPPMSFQDLGIDRS